MEVTVKLATREGAAHISGILAGFILLAKCGELTLQVQDERQGSPIAREALLETEIDGRTVVFDLMDGYFYNDPAAVPGADFAGQADRKAGVSAPDAAHGNLCSIYRTARLYRLEAGRVCGGGTRYRHRAAAVYPAGRL